MTDYTAIYDRMELNREYTAGELGVAPASMTAMVRRGMVVVSSNSVPKKYKRIWSAFNAVNLLLDAYLPAGKEFFTIHKKDERYGMLCSRKNGNILDCYGNKYPLENVVSVEINHNVYEV